MGVCERLIERLGLAAVVSPVSLTTAASAATSGIVDMSKAARALFSLAIGANTSNAAVAINIQASTSTVGSDFAAFATALQATGLTAENIQQQLELTAEQMPSAKRYLRAIVSAAVATTNTALVGLQVYTADHHYEPQTDNGSGVQTAVVRG